jgi:hypothetical protein
MMKAPRIGWLDFDVGGAAHQLMFVKCALGAFHIDVLDGSKLRAHPLVRRVTCLNVRITLGLKGVPQTFADWAVHGCPSGA